MAPTHAKSPIKFTSSKYNQKRSRELGRAAVAPIIKIVYVYAPRRVQTDVANFRALVQAMTGNDTTNCEHNIKDMAEKASTNEIRRDEEKPEAKTVLAQPRVTHGREGEVGEGEGRVRPVLEREWDCSVDEHGFFGEESEEACVEDYLYKMQQQYRSSAFFTNWTRQPLEIPDFFDYF